MKTLVQVIQCNQCKSEFHIILSSPEGAFHLCRRCVKSLLEGFLVPSRAKTTGFGPQQTVMCPCCRMTASNASNDESYMKFAGFDGETWVCVNCLLEAARKDGTFRISVDC